MKIAYIGGAYVPGRGADSVHQVSMCAAMASLGHRVTLHARPGTIATDDDFGFYGVDPTFQIVKHQRPQIRGAGALINAAFVGQSVRREDRPDLLYAREIYGLSACVPLGIPFIFESHWNPKHWLQLELEAWLFRRPNFCRVVFISDALRQIYQRRFPWLDATKMLVAHDAANPKQVDDVSPSTSARLRVGYVGGFLPGYGLDLLAPLAERHPEMDFVVVGGQDSAVADWRARTRHLPNLEWRGFQPPSELPLAYASLDVVVAPYQSSTAHIEWISPMKLFEYMAFGKALVCSDFPVMREIVQHDVTGLLVPSQDLDAWSAALRRLTDSAARSRLGNAAREALERDFTWAKRAARVLSGLNLNPLGAPST